MKRENIIKGFIFGGLVVGITVLAGCGQKVDQVKNAKEDIISKVENGKKMVDDGKGLVGGLKDAMKNGVAMKCEGNDGWVTYTNGKNIRSEGIEDGKTRIMLVTGGTTYTWTKGEKTGMKMEKKCLEDFQKDMGIDTGAMMKEEPVENEVTVEDIEKEEESGNMKCSPSTDADFSVPSGVKFEDQCKIMKEQMEKYKGQMQEMQNKIPSM